MPNWLRCVGWVLSWIVMLPASILLVLLYSDPVDARVTQPEQVPWMFLVAVFFFIGMFFKGRWDDARYR